MPKAQFASSIPPALIRRARLSDATHIGRLLHQLGYPVSARFVHRKLTVLLNDEKEDLLVAERDDTRVIGFLAMHCIPQIGVEGGFARISYLCVDKATPIAQVFRQKCSRLNGSFSVRASAGGIKMPAGFHGNTSGAWQEKFSQR